jgi:hypothetical protein
VTKDKRSDDDDETPAPEPVGDPEDRRPDASLEADDRTPEEAGYGYGV